MIHKKHLLTFFFILSFTIFFSGCVGQKSELGTPRPNPTTQEIQSTQVEPTAQPQEFEEFTASFAIYTNGTKRIFSDSKYHNQSPDVFLEAADPSSIFVKKQGIVWKDFFETLPFSLTKECLVTGTKQTFCTSQNGRLRFFLNGQESPDALELPIQAGDFLKVTFGE